MALSSKIRGIVLLRVRRRGGALRSRVVEHPHVDPGDRLRHRRRLNCRSWLALGALFLSAGCDSNVPAEPQPTDVAQALFDALRAGHIEPLVPFLPTEEDLAEIGVEDARTILCEHRSAEIAHLHKTLGVDWTTARLTSLQASSRPDGVFIEYRIHSARAEAAVEIGAARRGSRLVVATLHAWEVPATDGQR
jgi:hypothetical protein